VITRNLPGSPTSVAPNVHRVCQPETATHIVTRLTGINGLFSVETLLTVMPIRTARQGVSTEKGGFSDSMQKWSKRQSRSAMSPSRVDMYSEIRGRKATPTPYPNPEIPGTDHIVAGHHCQDVG